MPDHDAPIETRWAGRYISAQTRGRWEFVSRTGNRRAVVILAIEQGAVILVEQYRVPLGRACLELPAGIVGDEGDPEEAAETAAARELEEETGYRADRIEAIGDFYSSPGLVSEGFTLVRAHGLTQIGPGGGNDDEQIIVHKIMLDALPDFIAARRAAGTAMDVKLLLLLGPQIIGPALFD